MNQKDKTILIKIMDYCLEIKDTHDYFKQDKELFTNEKNGFIYILYFIKPEIIKLNKERASVLGLSQSLCKPPN